MLTEKELEIGSRAVLNLHGFFIVVGKDGNESIIDNPRIVINTLKASELYVMDYYDSLTEVEKASLEDLIVEENVFCIYGYEGFKINMDYTPAGVLKSIADSVLNLTYKYLVNTNGLAYKSKYEDISFLEKMQAIISHYLHIPFTEVASMSVSEIYRKHAICASTFSNQVVPLCEVEGNEL